MLHWLADHLVLTFIGFGSVFTLVRAWLRTAEHSSGKATLHKAIKSNLHEPMTLHPEIDDSACIGCGACTRACPEGQILQLIDHKAVLVSPTKCVGHGECEVACPMGAIELVFGTKTRGMDIPRLTTNFESNIPGLYIAGELGGMGLIRNAVKQGRLAAEHALRNLPNGKAQYDVLIVGAGPAGFAASLYAATVKANYLCIEQNTFGGTIANFPRQKLVMSHPFELPRIGPVKFDGNVVNKEQIMELWKGVRRQYQLNIKEGVRFLGFERADGIFRVNTSAGEITAKRVILGMGVRGSPRRLNIPGEDLPKVTYNLLDPAQYRGKNIVVVGGGNAAAEVALMLSDSELGNHVHLLVRGSGFDRCNEENEKKIRDRAQAKRLNLWFNTSTNSIANDKISFTKDGQTEELANDFVFIMAGAESPHKYLMGLGVQIEKKYGTRMDTQRKSA